MSYDVWEQKPFGECFYLYILMRLFFNIDQNIMCCYRFRGCITRRLNAFIKAFIQHLFLGDIM